LLAGTDDGRVWKFSPLFGNWTLISSSLPNRWVTRVAFDPVNASTLYVTFSGLRWEENEGRVFKSINSGGTWTDISGDLPEAPVNCLVVDPELPERVYVGTDVGCYFTSNEGADWQVLGSGLPNAPVLDLKFHQGTRTLVAGTHGRSMYSLALPVTSGVDDTPELAGGFGLTNHPNPFNPLTTLKFTLAQDGFVSLEIYSPRGEKVAVLVTGRLESGDHEVRWDGRDTAGRQMPSGVYLAKLTTAEEIGTAKLVLVR
jgi:hypothetical protein